MSDAQQNVAQEVKDAKGRLAFEDATTTTQTTRNLTAAGELVPLLKQNRVISVITGTLAAALATLLSWISLKQKQQRAASLIMMLHQCFFFSFMKP